MGRPSGTRFRLTTADLPIALPAMVLRPGTSLGNVRIVMPLILGKVSISTTVVLMIASPVTQLLQIIFQDNAQAVMTRATGEM
jgi:hypothetical protein